MKKRIVVTGTHAAVARAASKAERMPLEAELSLIARMMRKTIAAMVSVAVLAASSLSFAGGAPAPLSTPELKQAIGRNGKATLIFFQNPNGGPCKIQKSILEKLQQDRNGGFNIANVNAMNQNDQKAFYDYGVRSLPSLVLVDKAGKISRIFPPGIQNQQTLAIALDGAK